MDRLTNELAALEDRLRKRTPHLADGSGRLQILRSVQLELARDGEAGRSRGGGSGRWGAIAAAVLIALNISMTFASRGEFAPPLTRNPAQQWGTELRLLQRLENQPEGLIK
jgi:hypothetical protein